ncbi:acetyltransferase [Alkalihalobacterium chitinilyticum]|uniref:Acetyltransferase n=1 Tax=Alkalihalobacterium chitinilyticum TaxID=2980103 RepID=A0ABT5VHT0_9BACI|nr:acetyltransferase [Alkalihalobacterium chitinilyticum]MDE5413789.1 acetyltransferase [Alkalihalobacterium chitinilyticum]
MNIVIVGRGGHSKVVRDIIEKYDHYEVIGYLDDIYKDFEITDNIYTGPLSLVHKMVEYFNDLKFIIAIGNNKTRKQIVEYLNLPEEYYATFIHPTAVISRDVQIGHGTVIMANTVVNSSAVIGSHCILNTNSVIEHDNFIGDFVHISPKAALTGTVQVEEGVHIGAGASIIPNKRIGEWSVIGAGATVIHDIPAYSTAVGVPAKVQMKEGV